MKTGIFFCDIMGTLTMDYFGKDINKEQVDQLMKRLEEIKVVDGLHNMYFSLISSEHMPSEMEFFEKKIREAIKESNIQIGPLFSSTHFKEMNNSENNSKGTRCVTGKPLQIYQVLTKEISLTTEMFSDKDGLPKVYFADDAMIYHEFLHMFVDKKLPELDYQSFILGYNRKDSILNNVNNEYNTEGRGINFLNALLGEYVKRQKDKNTKENKGIEI